MTLGILLTDQLTLFEAEVPDRGYFAMNGLSYDQCFNDEGECLFYDILDDPAGISGIEIHLAQSHRLWQYLSDKLYVTFDLFPCLWFTNVREATRRNLEAFGGIFLYESIDQSWCILMDTSVWFTDEDRFRLKRLI